MKNKNLIYLLIANFLFSFQIFNPFHFIYLKSYLSFFEIGVFFSIYHLTKLALEIPAGKLSDKKGRIYSLKIFPILMSIGLLLTVGISHYKNLYYLAAITMGASLAFFSGTISAHILDLKIKNSKKLISYFENAKLSSLAISSLLAIFFSETNMQYTFMVSVILFLLGLIFLHKVKDDTFSNSIEPIITKNNIKHILPYALTMVVFNMGYHYIQFFIKPLFEVNYNGIILFVLFLFSMLGVQFFSKNKSKNLFLFAQILLIGSFLLQPVVGLYSYLLWFFLMGLMDSYCAYYIPLTHNNKSSILSLFAFFRSGAQVIFNPFLGYGIDQTSFLYNGYFLIPLVIIGLILGSRLLFKKSNN